MGTDGDKTHGEEAESSHRMQEADLFSLLEVRIPVDFRRTREFWKGMRREHFGAAKFFSKEEDAFIRIQTVEGGRPMRTEVASVHTPEKLLERLEDSQATVAMFA
jgi:hypothetical protein